MLTAVALLLGWWTIHDALVGSLARRRPDIALRLDPANAVAIATDFRQRIANGPPSPAAMHDWSIRARASLDEAPLSAAMVRMVASDPSVTKPERLLTLAERVSRRDSLLQIALIEAAVAAGRIDLALTHYDRALSIYPDTRPLLFPVLAGAIGEPPIRDGLVDMARRRQPWIGAFLAYAVQQAPSPIAVAALLTRMDNGPAAYPGVRAEEAALAVRLLAGGDHRAARALARRSAGAGADAIDRPGFSAATWMTPARPLTWSTAETEGVDAQLDGTAVTVTVGPGGSGLAFYRVLVVPPGSYRFAAAATAPEDGFATATGSWNLICLGASGTPAQLATARIDPARAGAVDMPVEVTGGCGAVRVGFTIDNLDGGSEAGIVLRNVAFAPRR